MEELLLGPLGIRELLGTVEQQQVRGPPALPPGSGDSGRQGLDELPSELLHGNERDPQIRPKLLGRSSRRALQLQTELAVCTPHVERVVVGILLRDQLLRHPQRQR